MEEINLKKNSAKKSQIDLKIGEKAANPVMWKAKWISRAYKSHMECCKAISKDSPVFRKEFFIQKKIIKATAYVFGLGWYELHLNGRKTGNCVLAPANTRYDKLSLYDIYDVTYYLAVGGNAVGLWLGNGYDENYSPWGWKWLKDKRVLLQIDLELEDGKNMSIVTDDTWKTTGSPIIYNDIYNGEIFDARLIQKGWDSFGFNDSDWSPVEIADAPEGELAPNLMPPVRVTDTLKPVSSTQPAPGVYVFDFGQNFAGWIRLKAKGPAGTKIEIRYSELVDKSGMIDPWTNRDAKATDIYILNGNGTEVYEPRFTYHGFRYAEITGCPGIPAAEDVEGCAVHSDVSGTGCFSTSNSLLNRIQSNIRWSILNNLMSIPTDCCQRDERTPCQMDSMVVEEAAIHNFNMHQYYKKWLEDIKDSSGSPDWGGDKVFLPWRLYWYYDDAGILAKYYENMKSYIDHVYSNHLDCIINEGYGDWCAPNDDKWESFFKEKDIVNTALFYKCTDILANTAKILGKDKDLRFYKELSSKIKGTFNKHFLNGGYYGSGSQTAGIMPLAFEMVPKERKREVAESLADNIIKQKNGHLDTGIFATRYLMDVLADNGYINVAYDILNKSEYPGFGYQIRLGATTLWEQWHDKGCMASHNHAMFAGIGTSFYTRLGGIRPLAPGYKKIGIKPYIPDKLEWVHAKIETVRGTIVSEWSKAGDKLILNVEIPPNSTALVSIPSEGSSDIIIDNKAGNIKDIRLLTVDANYSVFKLISGRYSIQTLV